MLLGHSNLLLFYFRSITLVYFFNKISIGSMRRAIIFLVAMSQAICDSSKIHKIFVFDFENYLEAFFYNSCNYEDPLHRSRSSILNSNPSFYTFTSSLQRLCINFTSFLPFCNPLSFIVHFRPFYF